MACPDGSDCRRSARRTANRRRSAIDHRRTAGQQGSVRAPRRSIPPSPTTAPCAPARPPTGTAARCRPVRRSDRGCGVGRCVRCGRSHRPPHATAVPDRLRRFDTDPVRCAADQIPAAPAGHHPSVEGIGATRRAMTGVRCRQIRHVLGQEQAQLPLQVLFRSATSHRSVHRHAECSGRRTACAAGPRRRRPAPPEAPW